MSLAAYQSVRRLSEAPRDTEHRLMGQITGEMIVARDAKKERAELVERGALYQIEELRQDSRREMHTRGG